MLSGLGEGSGADGGQRLIKQFENGGRDKERSTERFNAN